MGDVSLELHYGPLSIHFLAMLPDLGAHVVIAYPLTLDGA